jgi:hypothetical protein
MLVSNHSYGFRSDLVPDYYFGAYITDSRDWDNLLRNAPFYLMVVAAGNDGTTNHNAAPLNASFPQFDKLTGHSTSKNNLVVANAQDASVAANGALISVAINSSSSQGPTDDLRIKPDITGNGTGVYSTYESSDSAYASISGTSMASPNVTGSLLLLQEHYNNLNGSFMRSATLKGLALHTADDAGPVGPDAIWGWGLLNAKRAAEAISQRNTFSLINEQTIAQGQTITLQVTSNGASPLQASICWTDLPGTASTATNSSIAHLVNDLDIRVSKDGVTSLPWRLTGVNTNGLGDNIKDNFERIDVSGASGTYTITITHKGTLSGGNQNFSLVVTGIAQNVVCNATTPANLTTGAVASSTASLTWDAVSNATYQVQYRVVDSSTWTSVNSASNAITLTGLTPLTTYEAQAKTVCPNATSSAFTASVNFSTTEAQLEYCPSNGNSTADEYIGRVQFNTLNNVSGAGAGGYSNFTNLSTTLNKGTAYTLTVTPTWTGTVYAEGYGAWIDYNKNGTFESNELVWSQTATNATPVSVSFTIPITATDGPTRMRVSMKYNGVPTACESFAYGEVEDYTVNIAGSTGDTLAPSAPTNLAASTTYSFYVRAKDAAGNVSGNSNTVSATTLANTLIYCTSRGNSTADEWINRVQLGSINNTSGANGGYANFTNLSTNLIRGGSSNTITIVPGRRAGTNFSLAYRVWIDYNQNGIFDTGEQVYNRSRTTATSVSGSFTVPTTALTGPTRMRVSAKYNASPTACETFSHGEVEDYTVNITNLNGTTSKSEVEVIAKNQLFAYPNPTDGELFLSRIENVKQVTIFNTLGQQVFQSQAMERFAISHLDKGLYLLTVLFEDGTEQMIKISKNK